MKLEGTENLPEDGCILVSNHSHMNGTDVMMNVMDPGWLRTDLGGPNAPNAPETVVPGALVSVLLDDKKSGRWFSAQDYVGMSVADAVEAGRNV